MNKLLSVREYLSVEEASAYIQSATKEATGVPDLLKLILDRHFKVYWLLQYQAAELFDPDRPGLTEEEYKRIDAMMAQKPPAMPSGKVEQKSVSPDRNITQLNGYYAIDLDFNFFIEDTIVSWVTDEEGDIVGLDGVAVCAQDGTFYRLQERTPTRYHNKDLSDLYFTSCGDVRDMAKNTIKERFRDHLAKYGGSIAPDVIRQRIEEYNNKIDALEYEEYPDPNSEYLKKMSSFYIPSGKTPTINQLFVKRSEVDLFLEKLKGTSTDDVSTKSKNAYLRTIRVLCDALIDGLSEKPNTDAGAVLQKLELAGKIPPIGEPTLAKYLKDAAKLED